MPAQALLARLALLLLLGLAGSCRGQLSLSPRRGDFSPTPLPLVASGPPTPRHPFIFYHQRKCGGSSLRKTIDAAAAMSGIPRSRRFIPCHTPARCLTGEHSVETGFPARAIVAAHLASSVVLQHLWKVPEAREREPATIRGIDMSCMTNFREPLARVTSCLFFRYPEAKAMHAAGNLTREAVERFLTRTPNEYGRGCNNEAVRMLSGYGVEEDINDLTGQPELEKVLIDKTIAQMERCVVVMVPPEPRVQDEIAQELGMTGALSEMVLSHWYPWMASYFKTHKKIPHALNRGSKRSGALMEPWYEELVRYYNKSDFIVYEAAVRRFKQQLAVIAAEARAAKATGGAVATGASAMPEPRPRPSRRLRAGQLRAGGGAAASPH